MNISFLQRTAACGLSVLFLALTLPISAQTAWRRDFRLSASADILSVAADETTFVAVGRHGNVLTSIDGTDWIHRDSGTWSDLLKVVYFRDRFIAVGKSGGLFQSFNGIHWTNTDTGIDAPDISHGENLVIVLDPDIEAQASPLLLSNDGETWTAATAPKRFSQLTYGAGWFYAKVLGAGLMRSHDGISWSTVTAQTTTDTWDNLSLPVFVGEVGLMRPVASGNSIWLWRSTDGVNWTQVTLPSGIATLQASADRFVIVSQDLESVRLESADGLSWSTLPDDGWIPGSEVIVGDVRVQSQFHYRQIGDAPRASLNRGISVMPFPHAGRTELAAHDDVVISTRGFRSTDAGLTWEALPDGTWIGDDGLSTLYRHAGYAGGRFYVIVNDPSPHVSAIWSSPDGHTFTRDLVTDLNPAPRVAYANGWWVLPQVMGRSVLRSNDGSTWQEQTDALPAEFASDDDDATPLINRSLCSNGERFYLFGSNGSAYQSTDAITWEPISGAHSSLPPAWMSVGWAHGWFLARDSEKFYRSRDAVTWESFKAPFTASSHITFNGDHFIAVGRDWWSDNLMFIATSKDGTHWVRSAQSVSNGITDISSISSTSSRTFVTVADNLFVSDHGAGPKIFNPPTADILPRMLTLSYDLTIAAESTQPLSYQWSESGAAIPGATKPALSSAPTKLTQVDPIPVIATVSDGPLSVAAVHYVTVAPAEPPTRLNDDGIIAATQPRANGSIMLNLFPAIAGPNLSMQWYRDGQPIAVDYPFQSFSIPINAFNEGHRYHFVASNPLGTVTSATINVAWPTLEAPEIQSRSNSSGVSLSTTARNAANIQWRLNGQPLAVQNQPYLYLPDTIDPQDPHPITSGFIDAVIFNARETVKTSNTYRFQRDGEPVLPTTTPDYPFTPLRPGHLTNLSVRAETGPGDATLTSGFAISSETLRHTDRPLSLLLRGIGPRLTDFGIADPLSDPALSLFTTQGHRVAYNRQWIEPSLIDFPALFADLGAFPLPPVPVDNDPFGKTSYESALVHEFAASPTPFIHTTTVSAASGAPTGEALIELYLLPDGNGSTLENLSARGVIKPDNPLTVGFVIRSDAPVRLTLRALGPALADFGIADPAPEPRLTLFDADGNEIVISDSTYPEEVADLDLALGAAWVPPGSNNARLSVQLQPGVYSAQARDDTGGVVLVELYLGDLFVPVFPVEPVP